MGFKDDLETDIDSVFLNFDEFSEEIKIGDDIIAGILDEDLYQEKKFKLSEETREVFEEGVTLFVSKTVTNISKYSSFEEIEHSSNKSE